MPKAFRAIPAIALLLHLASSASASVVDQVAAVVDGLVITRSEVEELAKTQERINGERGRLSQREALDLLVDNALIEKEASRLGIGVSEDDVERAVSEVRKRNSVDEKEFLRAIEAQGISYGAYRREIRGQILRAKVAGPLLRSRIQVDDEAKLREYYLKHVADFCEPDRVTLGHVELSGDRAAAESARSKIAAGLDPREAARAYVEGRSYRDMGTLALDSLSEAVASAVREVPAGGVSPVVELEGKCHLFVVIEKQKGRVLPYEEVANRVRERYFAEKEEELYQTWLASLRERARIDRKM